MARTITFYTRKHCSLCDKAYAALDRMRGQAPPPPAFDVVMVDLDTEASAEKRAAYDVDVPVLELDGRKIMKHRVDEARLLRLLQDG